MCVCVNFSVQPAHSVNAFQQLCVSGRQDSTSTALLVSCACRRKARIAASSAHLTMIDGRRTFIFPTVCFIVRLQYWISKTSVPESYLLWCFRETCILRLSTMSRVRFCTTATTFGRTLYGKDVRVPPFEGTSKKSARLKFSPNLPLWRPHNPLRNVWSLSPII